MKTKNTLSRHSHENGNPAETSISCHSDRSGGIPLDQIVWNDTSRNNKKFLSFFSSFFGLKSVIKRDTSTPLGMIKWRRLAGFTLVELIVVITILAILGTIGFIQLWGFAGSARDSVRISNLTNLKKGLDLSQVRTGVYPLPESSVNITASWVVIGYQWFAKEQVESVAKLSPWATKDPSDTTMYTTYSTNANQTKMQAMVFLEDGGSMTSMVVPSLVTEAHASATSDYSKRFPSTTGDSLGILLGNSGSTLNQPVQESGTWVDIVTTTGSYTAYFNNTDTITGSGTKLVAMK